MGLYAAPPSYRFASGIGASSLLKHLRQRPDALLICEDVDDPDTLGASLGQGRERTLPCRVLFTTRRRNPYLRLECVDIGILPEPAALELLRSSAGGSGEAAASPGPDAARTISRALGHLPLPITLASAYLREHPAISADTYITRLTEGGDLSVPDPAEDIAPGLSARHESALAAVLRLQREALKSPAARQILATLAALAPGSHVPRRRVELLTGLSDEAQGAARSPLEQALSELRRLAIAEELAGRAVRLHPLIHASAAAPVDVPDEIVGDCAARVAETLGDPERLEREVFERGPSEVMLDLIAASALGNGASHTDEAGKRVEHLRRILETSGPVGWERARRPGMLLQHVRNHALFELQDKDLAMLAEQRLAARSLPYLKVRSKPNRWGGVRGPGLVDVTVTSDGCQAISTTQGGAITVWDISTGRPVRTLQGPVEWMLGPPALAGGGLVCLFASAQPGGSLTVWDLTSNRAAMTLEGRGREQVMSVAVSTNGRFAAALTNEGMAVLWDLTRPESPRATSIKSKDERHFSRGPGEERGLAVTDDGAAVLIALDDGSLAIWSLIQDRIVRPDESHDGAVTSFAVAPDSRAAVSGSADGTLKLWDLATLRLTRTLGTSSDQEPKRPGRWHRRHGDFPNAIASVALTADGRFAFAVSESRQAGAGEPNDDNALMIWDLAAGEIVLKLPSNERRRGARCAVAPDGRALVVTAETELEVVEWVR
jgi:WD40 repeat protein